VNANTINANFTLGHQDPASAATNRFECPGAVALSLAKGASAWCFYDTASAFWRVISVSAPAATGVVHVGTKLANNAAQAISTANSFTTLTFTQADWAYSGPMWVIGAPTRLTIPAGQTGTYLVSANVQSPTAANLRLRFMKNGLVCSTELRGGATSPISMSLSYTDMLLCAAGDYLEVQALLSVAGSVGGTTRDDITTFSCFKQNP
jgi:hypothetical protein